MLVGSETIKIRIGPVWDSKLKPKLKNRVSLSNESAIAKASEHSWGVDGSGRRHSTAARLILLQSAKSDRGPYEALEKKHAGDCVARDILPLGALNGVGKVSQ